MLNLFNKNKQLNNEDIEEKENLSDIEFYVNKKKGTVACKLSNCSSIAINRIYRYTDNVIRWIAKPDRYLIDDVYLGIAKCAPEDSFDEEYGKKVALLKAKALRGRAINKALTRFTNDVWKSLTRLEDYGIHDIPSVKAFVEGEDN